jgi:galactonate dehydratase
MPPVSSIALRYNKSESYAEALAWLDSPELLKGTVERVREVRALGMDVGVDFHGRVHKGMARQLAKLLESEGVLFIEGEKDPYLPKRAVYSHKY